MASASDAKLERLGNLHALLLETHSGLTRGQITERIAGYPEDPYARRQAFERDKAALRDAGVPVLVEVPPGAADDNVKAYRIDRERWHLPDLGLDPEERVAVGLALAAVDLDAEGASEPLAPFADVGDGDVAVAHFSAPPALAVANQAAAEHRELAFQYRDKARTLDPYGVLFRAGFWYVVGSEHDTDEVKVFRVDRVEGDVEAGPPGAFEIPAGFRSADQLAADPALIGDEPAVVARVRIDAGHAPRVVRRFGEERVAERADDGAVVIEMTVVNRPAFRSWVLGLLDHAEVLEPAELRQEVVGWLEEIVGAGS